MIVKNLGSSRSNQRSKMFSVLLGSASNGKDVGKVLNENAKATCEIGRAHV